MPEQVCGKGGVEGGGDRDDDDVVLAGRLLTAHLHPGRDQGPGEGMG